MRLTLMARRPNGSQAYLFTQEGIFTQATLTLIHFFFFKISNKDILYSYEKYNHYPVITI